MGAEGIRELLRAIDLKHEVEGLHKNLAATTSDTKIKKFAKRLKVLEAFNKSGIKPEWMVMEVLPVLPPELRPLVPLDGGRFATSDLNDLYRRVINRNNRLKRLLELKAPEIIVRNEKRMLQEAVDSLLDNGRRGKAMTGANKRPLKSLADMIKGKGGRFRQNLLGKRVDYSGRSVIVSGPELNLHQCGLPKRMALELFKPFVMRRLIARGLAYNIRSAKRAVEQGKPEVWEILEEVVSDHPVILNRAPTLHRLSMQAFMPVLIDSSAIQLHPLVCAAFNADFDGDQMAVHVPLSRYAVEEARRLMMSTRNLLSPSSGEPIVAPTLDMVLGCYYLTVLRPGAKGEGMTFASFDEAKLAYEMGLVDLQAEITTRDPSLGNGLLKTTVGRIIFNQVLPTDLGFRNEVMDKGALKQIVADCYRLLGSEDTARVVDAIKHMGFHYATRSGITIAVNDLKIPVPKAEILSVAEGQIAEAEAQYQKGLITDEERYQSTIRAWEEATSKMQEVLGAAMDRYGSLYMMATSGAKGNIKQILQMAGMRGLMSDPTGRIIELPIKSSFQEGLTVLEYFISTHGARKGLADTALRTADSGYLTRRLIDVAQDVVVLEEDCGTTLGIWLTDARERGVMESLEERVIGRLAAMPIAHPATGEILVDRDGLIDEVQARRIAEAGIDRVYVRSPMNCLARRGICQNCYGWSLGVRQMAALREAVGIIAAQSIGEPGTQLTMRTFHTGGVAGVDITQGLPRVEELFEARVPKGQAIISEIDGTIEILQVGEARRIRVTSSDIYRDERILPEGWELLVEHGQTVDLGTPLARPTEEPSAASEEGTALVPAEATLTSPMTGQVFVERDGSRTRLVVAYEEREEREYPIPAAAQIRVENGTRIKAGDQLTDGAVNPQDILRILGRDAVQGYLVEEVQKVYRSQGVSINDKHIETIARQMLRRVRVDNPGDTDFLPGELVDRFRYEEENARVLAEGGEPATAETVLLGVTKASLNTESFLAAASFQETTRVLAEAAVNGQIDRLQGLKENVIIGKLIPAQGLQFPEPPTAPPSLEVLTPLPS
ncbi:MAG: DNA-directed RNA polymerase subunit beta' [Chloroflexi bacterium]|nr:DNA-directed RNA polymerase subunit beta' [Chloroflexota bacterium]